jgi:hypothetical protein
LQFSLTSDDKSGLFMAAFAEMMIPDEYSGLLVIPALMLLACSLFVRSAPRPSRLFDRELYVT